MIDTIAKIASLVLAVVFHEVAHGYAAYRLGDPTARNAKRLTLNPLAHIDVFGSIVLPFILLVSNSPVLFGWAKPVPINPGYFRNQEEGVMIVGAAGPITNFVLALLAAVLFRMLPSSGLIGMFLIYLCFTNMFLGVFNLIPIPPLDGSRVAIGLLPRDIIPVYLRLERFGFVIIAVLLFTGGLDYIMRPVQILTLTLLGLKT